MRATFTQEQLDVERTMLELGAGGLELARNALDEGWSEPAFDAQLLEDYGALGLSEERGGFGSSLVDAAVAVEALARTLVPSRLPVHLAAVLTAAEAGVDVAAAVEGGERWSLAHGSPSVAVYGRGSDTVVAATADGVDVVPGGGHERESIDPTRPCAVVDVEAAPAALAPHATVIAAADLCGAGAGAVALAASYAADRRQFGRAIGSFQGVAFQISEAFVAVRAAFDLVVYAAWAVETGERTAARHVHAAKAKAGQAALFAAERCVQVHGGIGMTMEADPHLFLRRALQGDIWLGSARDHRVALGKLRVA